MTPAFQPLDTYDWPRIAQDLDAQGWAMLPSLFAADAAREMAQAMAATARPSPAQAGHGDRYALPDPLPAALSRLRADLYRRLLPVARAWAAALGQDASYPDDLSTYTQQNHRAGQRHSLSAILRLRADDYQPLLQHADGACVFPLRLIALLSEPGQDFTGGEVVMTEQRPRMQSRPMVLPLQWGDAAVIAVSHRPVRGAQGIYRVTARQAVSRVLGGERLGLELALHEAP
ncbi:2OG-Fe(II) oxygenase [Achromobacter sp. NPDC058515]|uniref:2OG-Fe(II) oxygenase n=1 Tax=Achromobacter sp. NPDC058515 TaxID=3346533 RepID=UPI00364637D3